MSKFLQFPLGFDAQVDKPIDKRMVVADLAERNLIPAIYRYDGLMTYVVLEQKIYVLKGGIENTHWELIENLGNNPTVKIFEYSNVSDYLSVDRNNNPATGTVIKINSSDFEKVEIYWSSKQLEFELYENSKVEEVLKMTIYGKTPTVLSDFAVPNSSNLIYTIDYHKNNIPDVIANIGGQPSENYFALKEIRALNHNNSIFILAMMNGFMKSPNGGYNIKAIQYGGSQLHLERFQTNFLNTSFNSAALLYQTPHLIHPTV